MHIFNFTEKVSIYKVVYISNGWDINSPLSFQFDYSRTLKGGNNKLPNSEQSYKGKVKTHNYIKRQNQSTTGKLWKP
jgi:hypothetical protein